MSKLLNWILPYRAEALRSRFIINHFVEQNIYLSEHNKKMADVLLDIYNKIPNMPTFHLHNEKETIYFTALNMQDKADD